MHWSSLTIWFVVLFIGAPAAFKNWTALALVYSWLVGVAWTQMVGEGIPMGGDIVRDLMVMVAVCVKANDDCDPSPGPLGWARDCLVQLSWCDRVVLVLFIPMWITYAVDLDPWLTYWTRWGAGIGQFVAAGIEALVLWRRGRAQAKLDDPTDWQGLRYEW